MKAAATRLGLRQGAARRSLETAKGLRVPAHHNFSMT